MFDLGTKQISLLLSHYNEPTKEGTDKGDVRTTVITGLKSFVLGCCAADKGHWSVLWGKPWSVSDGLLITYMGQKS